MARARVDMLLRKEGDGLLHPCRDGGAQLSNIFKVIPGSRHNAPRGRISLRAMRRQHEHGWLKFVAGVECIGRKGLPHVRPLKV